MPVQRLEWNEENLATVLADLYQQAETDENLHQQILNKPFDVLNERIVIPDTYRGGIFAREKGKQTLVIYPPALGSVRQSLPAGTTEAEPQKDFDPVCTTWTVW